MLTWIIALYIVSLAIIAGNELVAKVPAILHTPLMSGANFIHGIVLVGSMISMGAAETFAEQVVAFVGIAMAAGNAVGGYVVTERMLEMFQKSKK